MSLTALGRIQPYTSEIGFNGSTNPDPFTTATVQGQLVPQVEHPWQVIGGVAFLWKYVHLTAGVGYGYYFVPGLDIAYPKRTVIPDASLSVVL
jgi:hypothetical protein